MTCVRWILTPLVGSDLKLHPETRHTMPVMLTVIEGWSGRLRRIWILMPFVEEDVKLQTEHEKGAVLLDSVILCSMEDRADKGGEVENSQGGDGGEKRISVRPGQGSEDEEGRVDSSHTYTLPLKPSSSKDSSRKRSEGSRGIAEKMSHRTKRRGSQADQVLKAKGRGLFHQMYLP